MMINQSATQMHAYLAKNFYTLQQLAEHTEVDDTKILELIGAQCIPPHSYEVRNITIFSNTIIESVVNIPPIRYYHRSLINWIQKAIHLGQHHNLSEVAKIIRDDFNREFITAFGDECTPGCTN